MRCGDLGFYRDLVGLGVIFLGAGILISIFLPPSFMVVILTIAIMIVGYLIICSR